MFNDLARTAHTARPSEKGRATPIRVGHKRARRAGAAKGR